MDGPITETCRLCGVQGSRQINQHVDLIHFQGCGCKEYWISRSDFEDFLTQERWLNKSLRFELSALLREQLIRNGHSVLLKISDSNQPAPERGRVTLSYDELASAWPATVGDRLDRVLLNFAALSPTGGTAITALSETGRDLALLFARGNDEATYHCRSLIEQSLIGEVATALSLSRVCVTPTGWARVAELQSNRSSRNNPAFVAMWFGGDNERTEMDAAFSAIQGACNASGWRAIRSDTDAHNDFIMDKILGDIRRAPFVVADFTKNRNGVYIEAGFARGLGIPVIHTCKSDHFENAHFDIKQINTIKWNTVDQLREGVLQRIRGTIGEGPGPIAAT